MVRSWHPPDYKYISEDTYNALGNGSTGFSLVEDNSGFESLTTGDTPDRVFGIAPVATTLQQAREDINTRNDVVDLDTMTKGALNVLDNDEDGFFLMVEGGAIDWTGHANQTERAEQEVEDFFEAVDAVNEWVETNSSWEETLVIVTADHETGYLNGSPEDQFSAMVPQGVGQYPTLTWNSTNHTNQLAPFFFKGAGAEELATKTIGRDTIRGRYLDNTALASWILGEQWVAQEEPTPAPTTEPSADPTTPAPTTEPTVDPTEAPTSEPTSEPSAEPTTAPTSDPSVAPVVPAPSESAEPTAEPTSEPPSAEPTSAEPTEAEISAEVTETVASEETTDEQTTEVVTDVVDNGSNNGGSVHYSGSGNNSVVTGSGVSSQVSSSQSGLANTGAGGIKILLAGSGVLAVAGAGLIFFARSRKA